MPKADADAYARIGQGFRTGAQHVLIYFEGLTILLASERYACLAQMSDDIGWLCYVDVLQEAHRIIELNVGELQNSC